MKKLLSIFCLFVLCSRLDGAQKETKSFEIPVYVNNVFVKNVKGYCEPTICDAQCYSFQLSDVMGVVRSNISEQSRKAVMKLLKDESGSGMIIFSVEDRLFDKDGNITVCLSNEGIFFDVNG